MKKRGHIDNIIFRFCSGFYGCRQLKTVTEGEVGGIMTLETPNTLSGLGAALLTECEVCYFRKFFATTKIMGNRLWTS